MTKLALINGKIESLYDDTTHIEISYRTTTTEML